MNIIRIFLIRIFLDWVTNYGYFVTNTRIGRRMEIIFSFFEKCVDKMGNVW